MLFTHRQAAACLTVHMMLNTCTFSNIALMALFDQVVADHNYRRQGPRLCAWYSGTCPVSKSRDEHGDQSLAMQHINMGKPVLSQSWRTCVTCKSIVDPMQDSLPVCTSCMMAKFNSMLLSSCTQHGVIHTNFHPFFQLTMPKPDPSGPTASHANANVV